ncbi:MAG: Lrp/AsnC ligand binding domain-containing protein [Acidimicrobiia bacterium]|nr:Lrp/AsnC ligand binding domain-containing protein [Acidimicrobiia bacterium]
MEAYVLIQTEILQQASVADAVGKIPGVGSTAAVIGPYDVIARVAAEDIPSLGKLVITRIQSATGVLRTITCPVVHL